MGVSTLDEHHSGDECSRHQCKRDRNGNVSRKGAEDTDKAEKVQNQNRRSKRREHQDEDGTIVPVNTSTLHRPPVGGKTIESRIR